MPKINMINDQINSVLIQCTNEYKNAMAQHKPKKPSTTKTSQLTECLENSILSAMSKNAHSL